MKKIFNLQRSSLCMRRLISLQSIGKRLFVALVAMFGILPMVAQDYLTFTARENNLYISLEKVHTLSDAEFPNVQLQYKVNNEGWKDFPLGKCNLSISQGMFGSNVTVSNSGGGVRVSKGQSIQFRAKNDGIQSFSKDQSNFFRFVIVEFKTFGALTGDFWEKVSSGKNPDPSRVDISGNVMSLIDNTCQLTSLSGKPFVFYRLFDCSETPGILKNSKGDIPYSGSGIFTNYLAAYGGSFYSGPDLPAAELAPHCYESMFEGCNYLTTAPKLPAEYMVEDCYKNMFKGCSSLTYINAGFDHWEAYEQVEENEALVWKIDEGAGAPTSGWVEGVAADGTFACSPFLYSSDPTAASEFGNDKIPTQAKHWKVLRREYLNIRPKTAGDVAVSLSKPYYGAKPSGFNGLQYRYAKDTEWHDYVFGTTTITINKGSTSGQTSVYFKAKSKNSVLSNTSKPLTFSFTGSSSVIAQGNLMSLLDEDVEVTGVPQYAFCQLFNGCTSLVDAENTDSPLSISATSLSEGCFQQMFMGCTGITSAVTLDAEVMAKSCYQGMFQGCENLDLTQAILPATSLAEACYKDMYKGCKKLTSAPELPATQLQKDCYYGMFNGCQKLNYIRVGFEAWNEYDDLTSGTPYTTTWVEGVTTTDGKFYCPSALKINYGDSFIPTRWNATNNSNVINGGNEDYLCFTSLETGNTLQIVLSDNLMKNDEACIHLESLSFAYKLNNGSWTNFQLNRATKTKNISGFGKNDRIYVKAVGDNNKNGLNMSGQRIMRFSSTKKTAVSGNVMSLLDGVNFDKLDVVPPYAFACLFFNGTKFTSAPKLPAHTVGEGAYEYMFGGSGTAIEVAPELPAQNLGNNCYRQMFNNCKNLVQAPILPAEKLKQNCYNGMFQNCTDLTMVSNIAAKENASNAMYAMFNGCSKLSYIKVELPGLVSYGTNWVKDVAQSGTFIAPKLGKDESALQDSDFGANKIPFGPVTEDGNTVTKRWAVNPAAFCIEAKSATTIALKNIGGASLVNLQYRKSSASQYDLYTDEKLIKLSKGESVYFRATVNSVNGVDDYLTNESFSESDTKYYRFDISGTVVASGDIMSLLKADGTIKSVPNYGFAHLFDGCTGLQNLPELPATTLGTGCYEAMFKGCTGLSSVPSNYLPAKSVSARCYKEMFSGCSNITDAPVLESKAMATSCYQEMFLDCKSLKAAPALPSTQLAASCYEAMFRGCTNIPVAPELPATELVSNCYKQLFYDCEKLGFIKVYFGSWGNDNEYTENWVKNVPVFGVFLSDNLSLPHENGDFNEHKIPYDGKNHWIFNPSYPAFTANLNNSTVSLVKVGNPHVKYFWTSSNTVDWTPYALDDPITLKKGETIFFRGGEQWSGWSNTLNGKKEGGIKTDNHYYNFKMSGSIAASGEFQYLAGYGNNSGQTWEDYVFYKLFDGCTALTSGLTVHNHISDYAYKYTYNGCINLTTPGVQTNPWPLNEMKTGAFYGMFYGCNRLEKPLFISLQSVGGTASKEVFAHMYHGCENLSIAPVLGYATMGVSCFESMFEGCKNLRTAPELPATVLAKNCYKQMFKDCENLNFISVGFKNFKDNNDLSIENPYTENWVLNVAPKGNFIGPAEIKDEPNNDHRIPIGWNMADPSVLCFTILEGSTGFELKKNGITANPGDNRFYPFLWKKNDELTWHEFPTNNTGGCQCSVGDQFYIKAKNASETFNSSTVKYTIEAYENSARVAVSGNLMSLIDPSGMQEEVPDYAFYQLFKDCSWIKSASQLLLPATILGKHCYESMFENCVNLVSAPTTISAAIVDESCCESMFKNCSELQSGPSILPAEELSDRCYQSMFMNCSKLISTPSLPATILATDCYHSMFSGCSRITDVPSELPAVVMPVSACEDMFNGCSSIVSAPTLEATTLSQNCYKGMFRGCIKLTSGPNLPAEVLSDGCYEEMFQNCTNLKSLTVQFSDWGDGKKQYTQNWVSGVNTENGTFSGPSSLNPAVYGVHNIPSSWFALLYDDIISNLPNGECKVDDGWSFKKDGAAYVPELIPSMTGTGALSGSPVVHFEGSSSITFDVPMFDKIEKVVFLGTTATSNSYNVTIGGQNAIAHDREGNSASSEIPNITTSGLAVCEYDLSSLNLGWGDDFTINAPEGLYGKFIIIGQEKKHAKTPVITVDYASNTFSISSRPVGSPVYWSTNPEFTYENGNAYHGPVSLDELGVTEKGTIKVYAKAYPTGFSTMLTSGIEFCESGRAEADIYFYPTYAGFCTVENVEDLKFALDYARHTASAKHPVKIFLPAFNYDLGSDCMTEVGSYTSLIGQNREKTIICSTPTETDYNKNATLFFSGKNNYVQDLTIVNNGSGPAVVDAGSDNAYIRSGMTAQSRAYWSRGNNKQTAYLLDSYLTAESDLMVGNQNVWVESCSLTGAMGTVSEYNNGQGYVFKNCDGRGNSGNIPTIVKFFEQTGWTPQVDATQTTLNSEKSSLNGSTLNVYEKNGKQTAYLVEIDSYENYALSGSNSFYVHSNLEGRTLTVRVANDRGGFGDPRTMTALTSSSTVKKEITLNAKGYASLYLDYDVQVIGASAYTAQFNKSHGVVTLYHINPQDIVPANTGVILFGNSIDLDVVELHEADGSSVSVALQGASDILTGTLTPIESTPSTISEYYVLSGDVFKHLKKDGGKIAANKAFFQFGSDDHPASSYRMVFGLWDEEDEEEEETTAIENLATSSPDSFVDLLGRKTDNRSGILIENDRVIMVK